MKKLISVLLLALMMVSLVPASVFADVSVEEYLEKYIINFWESNVWIQTTEVVNLRNMPCSEETNSNSEILVKLPKDSYLLTTGIYQNNRYNLWYRVLYEGQTYYAYINRENFPASQIDWKHPGSMSFENLSVPEIIVQGETDVAITGVVKSPYSPLLSVGAYLEDSGMNYITDSRKLQSADDSYEFDIAGSEFLTEMNLGGLEPGEYYIRFVAEMNTGYVASSKQRQEICYYGADLISDYIKFTVVEAHTCNYEPTGEYTLRHPHREYGECAVCKDRKILPSREIKVPTKEVIVKEATCTEEGQKNIVCAVGDCGKVLRTEAIEMADHVPVIKKGKQIICKNCKTVLLDSGNISDVHRHVYTKTTDVETDHPHRQILKCECGKTSYGTATVAYETTTTESTCTQAGETVYSCATCEIELEREELPLAEHTVEVRNQSEAYTGDKVCTVCDKVIEKGTDIGGEHVCNYGSTGEYKEAHPHNETLRCACGKQKDGDTHFTTKKDITPSTCAVAGSEKEICEVCGEVLSTKELPLAEHTVEVRNQSEAYTGDKVCTVCDKVIEKGATINSGEYILGDVNKDGSVDAKDATQILRSANGKTSAFDSMSEAEALGRGDVNKDGSVDAKDATQILRFVNGKPSVLSK